MSSAPVPTREKVLAVYDRWEAVNAEVNALRLDALSPRELLELSRRRETVACASASADHQILNRLAHSPAAEVGGGSLAGLLADLLHITPAAAKQRLQHAAALGDRRALTGEQLPPLLAAAAAAQARGQLSTAHIKVLIDFDKKLPAQVGYDVRESANTHLAQLATTFRPDHLAAAAEALLDHLNPDGDFDDHIRAQRRTLTVARPDLHGMSRITGWLTPEARATFDAVMATLAAPGKANPADENPCVDGDPDPDTVARDTRSPGQRNHDALTAMGRAVLASGRLGQHNGLPATIIVTASLQDLQAATGHGLTAGGTRLPMRDVIRLASQAHHYLVIYDQHTNLPLYCARAKRFATPGQRIVLHAMDRGCTRPGCTTPGYWCQVHHVQGWVSDNGPTNITTLTLACAPHNRMVENAGWTTRKRADNRTEWIPPQKHDTGQPRTNNYHHPQRYLTEEEPEAEGEGHQST